MDSALENLKKKCLIKEAKSFADLDLGFHEILSLRNCKTKFGMKVCIELEDFVMFLPERVKIGEQLVEELNEYALSGKGKLYLNYMGKNGTQANSAVLLDFEKMDFNPQDAFNNAVAAAPPRPPPSQSPAPSSSSFKQTPRKK